MKYGLIGEKLGHSYSVEIHSAIANYDYELCEIPQNEIESFFKKKDFNAVNVTIPYKQTVIPFLDYISENAETIGSVNTVVNKNGKLFGYNTDFFGMTSLIKKMGLNLEDKKVLVLGTGGTSKTAFAVAKSMKATEILVVSRTAKNGNISYDEAINKHNDSQIIINTTPCGMFPNNEEYPIDIENFKSLEGVVDAVYNPLKTTLVISAQKKGIKAHGGLYMLSAQGALASSLFLNKDFDYKEVETAYNHVLKIKRNIVLIGMPSSGKTSVGKALSKKTAFDFVDTDDEIIRKIKMPIARYFEEKGENSFRIIESEVVESLSKTVPKIIATGGGVVLNEKNIDRLKQNGVIVFLDRSIENLVATSDRPLSSSKEKLQNLFCDRYSLYKKYADITVNSDQDISGIVDDIVKELAL